MLVELAVRNLGVIESARIPFEPGLIALTGETGAGKTMLIEALSLLAGQKADPSRVRVGAEEAVVEGLFADGESEWVLRRVVPVKGRSKAYLNGELATAATLAEVATDLLEMHGQHAQQKLFSSRAHRDALDEFGGIDTSRLDAIRSDLRAIEADLSALGGDERARAREIGLLEFQLDEIDSAEVRVGEDSQLGAEEDLLAGAQSHLEAAAVALAGLRDDGAAIDAVSSAIAALRGRSPYLEIVERLANLDAELSDVADSLRSISEAIEPDPERLDAVQQRRNRLLELRRKYGETDQAVLDFAEDTRSRLNELTSHDERVRELTARRVGLEAEYLTEARKVGDARRGVAGELARRIEEQLRFLAMPAASMVIDVRDSSSGDGGAGDEGDVDSPTGDGADVEFLISTNPGVAPGPLGRVASGGELSRVMLALRLVLSESPPTTVFDEIDAGIGGEAAVEVGKLLAQLSVGRQVLVVTHLPQVAAFADVQVRIEKSLVDGVAETRAAPLDHTQRLVELSRMISGQPDSESARLHAEELLEIAAAKRRKLAS